MNDDVWSGPVLLDVCCSAGGASVGYYRAGFRIVGVDKEPQPRYPYRFVQMDALEALRVLLAGGFLTDDRGGRWFLADFAAIHVSPPCQGYSLLAFAPNRNMSNYPKLIEPLRELLIEIGLPWVLENVPQAPLRNPLVLCGTMFGLRTHRHRAFEIEPPVYFAPAGCAKHMRVKAKGEGKRLALWVNDTSKMVTVAGHTFSKAAGSAAMGIDWMTRDELAEAIPPAFTEYIGTEIQRAIAHGR